VPNRGKGHALRHGFARSRGKWLAFIDADLDIDPSSIGPLLQPLLDGNADVAVASKVHPGSSIHYPPFRRLQSKVFRTLVHTAFSLDVHDTQTGLKVFTHTVLERCLPLVRTDGFAFDVELLVLANDAGFRIVEGPVLLDYQFSSSTGAATVSDMLRELADIWRRRRRARKAGEWITPN
jgi:glycosyltransferase involved in cell wall biosynthesis